jgi:hypothetical protein
MRLGSRLPSSVVRRLCLRTTKKCFPETISFLRNFCPQAGKQFDFEPVCRQAGMSVVGVVKMLFSSFYFVFELELELELVLALTCAI